MTLSNQEVADLLGSVPPDQLAGLSQQQLDDLMFRLSDKLAGAPLGVCADLVGARTTAEGVEAIRRILI